MKKKWVKRFVWLLVVVVLAAVVWSLFFKPKDQMNFVTDDVRRSDIMQTVNATGEIAAAQLVDVGAQASGQIKKLYVKLGQQVKKGDLIADIDSTTQLNTLNTNKAKLDTYRAQLVSAQIALKMKQRAFDRERALMGQDATSKADFDNAQDNLAAARANVAELKSQIRQTQIAINTSEADLGYTRITAPMDGTVVSIPVEEGQTVNSSQNTPTIVQLADLSKMLNKMQIAEGDMSKVKAGMHLTFTTLADNNKVRKATLEAVDPGLTKMSQGSYDTSTDTTDTAIYYYARALVPNDDGTLHIGMTTQNNIFVKSVKNVLTVSNQAIRHNRGKKVVKVLGDNQQVQEKQIETGITDGMRTEVKSGLKEGDRVVLSALSKADAKNGVSKEPKMRGPRM
ncbi:MULTISPECIES: efflux RND transporter periplasmic adaptor subunit [Snodgrassella]|uniref:efflux RND transporter periplasmic adaptor subunit n=1 Tax=Snodgrassella TaxID=1193515 RepID=UPI000996090D|nr:MULTISPECIES: efflux RND transporter periplasmic adaptor subunit [Snodgrassella]MBI0067831.1 efflux RND transporter periplasmic adaptor subunit [Snodgrassella sp. M0110]MBI0076830.1 efflux RND transporter periplasmic adaptor subunit [Snodgrassella sp. M0118]MBI0079131.1 efflux RND transporter periplasmic adaptor subunit [Snodgrassella sp. M0112]MBI0129839.1 efflux RND transporter periplasmic adaptor subunit [Snodgrassella sp. W8124]MBI0133310.1 efflux RND transporter periplasmic adaptor sub